MSAHSVPIFSDPLHQGVSLPSAKLPRPRQLLLHCPNTVRPWTYAHAPYLHPWRQLLLHCSNTVHPWTYAPKRRKAAARATTFRERSFGCAETALTPSPALDGIKMSARSLWYRSLRSTYPPGTGGSPSAPMVRFCAICGIGYSYAICHNHQTAICTIYRKRNSCPMRVHQHTRPYGVQ